MEINPFIGVGEIKFGQPIIQVQSILGTPDEKNEEIDSDGERRIIIQYHKIGIHLDFSSEENYKLGGITLFSKDFTFKGVKLIGISELEFLNKIVKLNLNDFRLDDNFEDLGSKDYTIDSLGLSFWISDNIVDSICIFPKFSPDGDDIIWPK